MKVWPTNEDVARVRMLMGEGPWQEVSDSIIWSDLVYYQIDRVVDRIIYRYTQSKV